MILTFRHLSGKSFQIDIDPNSSIIIVKQIFSKSCGISSNNIRFLFRSQLIPDSELIKNLYIQPNDFILFYEEIPESELNQVSDDISTPPQLCHIKGAPPLLESQINETNYFSDSNQLKSPDFYSYQELQIMKPYLKEPIISQVGNKPDVYAFVDTNFNSQFSSEFKPFKLPVENTLRKEFTELLRPTYPIVEVSEKVQSCVDLELKNAMLASSIQVPNINYKPNLSVNLNANISPNVNSQYILNSNSSIYANSNTNLKPNFDMKSILSTNSNFRHNSSSSINTQNLNTNSNLNPNTQSNPIPNINYNSKFISGSNSHT